MKKKFNLLFGALLASCSLLSIVGCKKNDASNDNPTDDQDTQTPETPSDPSGTYQLNSFELPSNLKKYNQNLDDSEKDSEDSYKIKSSSYEVGDDNPFIFKPQCTFYSSDGQLANIDYKIDLEIFDDKKTKVGSDIYTFNEDDSSIQFKEAAIGNTYALKALPKGYTKIGPTQKDVEAVEFTLTVQDGYNCYNALDLGRINLIDKAPATNDEFAAFNLEYGEDGKTGKIKLKENNFANQDIYYYQMWKAFLESKGQTDLKEVNGLFIHNDLKITKDVLPSEYFATEDEIKNSGITDKSDIDYILEGSFRDFTTLYTKLMTDNNFIINGNLFTIDSSELPLHRSMRKNAYGSDFLKKNDNIDDISHSNIFKITHKNSDKPKDHTAILKNLNSIGNLGKVTSNTDIKKEEGALTPSFIRSTFGTLDIDNVKIKNYCMGVFGSGNYGKETLNVSNSRIYDCYSCACYLWGSDNNQFKNCEMKRFGAPVFLSQNPLREQKGDDPSDTQTLNGNCGVTCDDKCTFESLVSGTEAWFNIVGAAALIPSITGSAGLEGILNSYNATMLNQDSKFNCLYIALPFNKTNACNSNFQYGSYARLNTNDTHTSSDPNIGDDAIEQGESDIRKYQALLNQGAPYLKSLNKNETGDISGVFVQGLSASGLNDGIYQNFAGGMPSDYYAPGVNTLTGDYLQFFMSNSSIPFGELNVVLSLYPKANQ